MPVRTPQETSMPVARATAGGMAVLDLMRIQVPLNWWFGLVWGFEPQYLLKPHGDLKPLRSKPPGTKPIRGKVTYGWFVGDMHSWI